MKRFKKYILKNWFWICLGLIFTRKAMEIAYIERGYKAIGGEILIVPTILLVVHIVSMICESVLMLWKDGDKDE